MDGPVFFRISTFFYRIRRFASELIAHACINTRNSRVWIRKNYVIARKQIRNEHGASFQPSPKINCMLITRLICIKWKFTAPGQKKHSHIHHTRPPPRPPPPPRQQPHFGAHTRQKKRNAWVSQLKQARLTSKNKKVDIFLFIWHFYLSCPIPIYYTQIGASSCLYALQGFHVRLAQPRQGELFSYWS